MSSTLLMKEHFKTLLNRLAPSAPELEYVHRPICAVNEEPPTDSEVLACIQKMKNGKPGGDDGISAEMLKYLPPSGIREMTKIIRSIWINERIPDSWRLYHNSPPQEVIRHGPQELSRNLFAACYVQGTGVHYPGPTH
ncbi:hypothetical protein RB195_002517 [Necator americanus]|uniref:Uncharacterized protein n=1 Tax=Necator americanus TaxID=51031 RepID=A0ABR1DJE1_NECAM